nr:EOG090X07WR [Cyclestheria hislopi]
MSDKRIKNLVADSAAFIKNSPLQDIAETVYTIKDVVSEIRDQATRQRLRVLPYELKMMEPSPEALKFVTEFSKKTGDFASLSATDMKVLALTYQLETEINGNEHLKTEPKINKSISFGPKPPVEKPEQVAGFYMPKVTGVETIEDGIEELSVQDDDEWDELEDDEDVGEEEEEELDNEDGWITPANIQQAKSDMNGLLEQVQLEVACLTMDFAMQNVLMQIGLHVVSLDGKLIREARTYILRCYACFHTTTNVTKQFCPKCGEKLQLEEKKFSLPMPKGGKYAENPILVEDQREAQKRASKLGRTKTNAMDPDYLAGNSPFAVNDVYSRAAQLGRHGKTSNYWNRRNPNEARKKKR